MQRAAKDAIPKVRKVYAEAGRSAAEAHSDVARVLAAAGAAGQPFAAAGAREEADFKRRLGESAADSQTELVNRGVDAAAGRAYATANAQRRYAGEALKLYKERKGLGEDVGAFIHGTYKQLQDDEAKAAAEERRLAQGDRRLDISLAGQQQSHEDAIRGQDITLRGQDLADARAKAKAKKGKKKFTPVQLRDARAMWGKGTIYARELKKRGKLTEGTGNAVVAALVKRGVHEPIARGVVQTYLYGGVRANQRHIIQRDYGLKPKLRHKRRGPATVRGAFPGFYGR